MAPSATVNLLFGLGLVEILNMKKDESAFREWYSDFIYLEVLANNRFSGGTNIYGACSSMSTIGQSRTSYAAHKGA